MTACALWTPTSRHKTRRWRTGGLGILVTEVSLLPAPNRSRGRDTFSRADNYNAIQRPSRSPTPRSLTLKISVQFYDHDLGPASNSFEAMHSAGFRQVTKNKNDQRPQKSACQKLTLQQNYLRTAPNCGGGYFVERARL